MADLLEGLVIAHLGQGIAVETAGKITLCQSLRKLDTIAVGDRVLWLETSPNQGRVEQILPRKSLLIRPSRNTKTRAVAANIDTVYVVFAIEPPCDFLLIDQYLAVCENINISAALILNKTDLIQSLAIESELQIYQDLGYKLHRVSAIKKFGVDELKSDLKNRLSIFAGQSGVGKSSLTNAIIPDRELKTNTISSTSGLGRHTTTAATLYHIPDGGDLIDSPGLSVFGLADLSEQQLALGYREFKPLLDSCRFNDCRHLNDKDCAVRGAAETGKINMSRYLRFLKLRGKMSQNHDNY
jgi:ribosome biogenesis GTPase